MARVRKINTADEGEIERLVLPSSPKFQGILRAARQQIREEGGIEHEAFWHKVEGNN